eukprot:TRINITY_DN4327_c0_g1_i8.p1 TRINITY_DN4327_c0_g1~~TRINITY_DN4327_c0_g1_i8.p1  ORF type:complete len:236 (+),score=30.77 TRINITY_DN4327_c0_g1_i8:129-836(+)
MGKPLKQADGEVSGMFQRIKALIKMAPSVLADENFPEKNGIKKKITKEPVGVVLVIGPWNYPLLTVANSLIPAVLAGNAVIIKHSPRTPLVAEFFSKAFSEAGIPSGLVSYLHAPNEVVAEVISQEPIGFVSFTGSVAGGRQVYKTVAESRFIDISTISSLLPSTSSSIVAASIPQLPLLSPSMYHHPYQDPPQDHHHTTVTSAISIITALAGTGTGWTALAPAPAPACDKHKSV